MSDGKIQFQFGIKPKGARPLGDFESEAMCGFVRRPTVEHPHRRLDEPNAQK